MTLLHERVSRSAERHPDRTALVLGERSLTYAELELLAERVRSTLVEQGCAPGDRVALLLPKEPETIAAMLGTLKAGCAYVPVDVASPAPRAGRIIASAAPKVALLNSGSAGLLDGVVELGSLPAGCAIGTLHDEPVEGEAFASAFDGRAISTASPSPASRPHLLDDHVAHILFTSGSTGAPKGVPITHRNVTSFLDWAVPFFGIDADDRLSSHPPLHFDLSTFDVFGALSSGAELHLVDPALNLSPRALARFIEASALTQWFSVPSTMTFLSSFDAVPDGGWPALRRVLFCGEVLPTPVLRHWMLRLPHASFTNLYGPTEATIASSYHRIAEPPADETVPIPIGVACAQEELVVLDEELRPVTTGEVGELAIGGAGLSPGYWHDEERTALAFIPDPRRPDGRLYRTGDLARVDEDGVFHFLGRVDSQIKSRGYRIELGEIETALNALPAIAESAVVAVSSDGFEGVQIACAYAPAPGGAVAPTEVKAELTRTLPRYMLPTRWLVLDDLPKNPNGKIDRSRLRDLFLEPAAEPALTGDDR